MNVQSRYREFRFNDRPIANPLVEPEDFVLEPGAVTADYEAKPGHRLSALYPDIAAFRTYATERYFSREVMAQEWQRMWRQVWQIAGRATDIPDIGDWFRYDIGAESFIIVRDPDRRVRAYYNVCKHRGNRLVHDDFGKGANSFTCLVHSWRWNLKGRNVRVTDRDTFSPQALCGDLNLGGVHCREWGGFVFINMAEQPIPFEEYYGDMLTTLDSYRMDELFVVKDVSVELPANWKTIVDTFSEAYHAHATHPQIKPTVEDHFVQTDFYPNGHNRMLTPVGEVSCRWIDRETVNEGLAYLLQEAGVDPASYAGDAAGVRRAIQQAKRRPNNSFGIDYGSFTDNQLTDDWNPSLFPNVTLNAHPEGVLFMRMRPHASDPERAYYDVMVLSRKLAPNMRPPAYMGVDPDVDVSGAVRPPRQRTTEADPQAGELLEQDVFNIANMQRGMHSQGLGGVIRYSEQERRIQQFHAELELYLTGAKGAGA